MSCDMIYDMFLDVAYKNAYIKPGFWANSFAVEFVDPKLLDL